MIGCHCAVCSSLDPHDKRGRSSVVISHEGRNVLIDATPELRLQCIANSIDMIDAVVFTHAHADHIMGLDDVRRFNALRGGPLDVWADDRTFASLDRIFHYAFAAEGEAIKTFRPQLIHRSITGAFDAGGLRLHPIPLIHGDAPVLGFRVGNLAYCTDVSSIPEPSFELLKELDVLVLDALQWRKHATHFTVEEAIDAATRIGAKQTLFTHIAHGLGHEVTNAKLPPTMRLAHDGQRVVSS